MQVSRRLKVLGLIAGAIGYGILYGEYVRPPLLAFLSGVLKISDRVAGIVMLIGLLVPAGALIAKAKGIGWSNSEHTSDQAPGAE